MDVLERGRRGADDDDLAAEEAGREVPRITRENDTPGTVPGGPA